MAIRSFIIDDSSLYNREDWPDPQLHYSKYCAHMKGYRWLSLPKPLLPDPESISQRCLPSEGCLRE